MLPQSSKDPTFAINTPPSDNIGRGSFGGMHPGICHFLFGDGSVHAVDLSISPNTIYALCDVDDGASVTFP